MKDKNLRKYIGWFIFAVALITIYKTIDSVGIVFTWFQELIKILAPFGLALLLAYLLYFPCRRIENLLKKVKIKIISKRARFLSIAIVYILMLLIIIAVFKLVIPVLYESIVELAKSLPNYYNRTIKYLEEQPEDSLWNRIDMISYVKKLEKANIPETIMNTLNYDNISKYIRAITSVAGVVFDIFITVVVSFYILIERTDIKNFLKNLLKAVSTKEGYKKIARYYEKTNHLFYKFISAQILDAFLVGIITTIAMLIMNVRYAGLLGFLIGLFNIIPYFGAIVAVGIAIIVTIFTGGLGQALWLALVIIILQQVDANIINPKIIGDSLDISRILIIFSVTLFGAWFGVLGMFLAVPMIGLIKIFVLDFIDEKEKEKEKEKKA